MARGEYDFPPFVNGLVIPDTSAETPAGSLTIATNVDVTDIGAIRQRAGMSLALSGLSSASTAFQLLFIHNATTPQMNMLMADGTGRIQTAGTVRPTAGSTFTGGPLNATDYAQMQTAPTASGTPASKTYVASPTSGLYAWDGSAFASVLTTLKARYIVQGGKAQRMYAAGFSAGTNGPASAQTSPSTLWFSDAENPASWNAASYQDFYAGDGEDIQGLAVFNDQIFVFKKSRFFIVYSETTFGGATTLNWREVTGAGLVQPGAFVETPLGIFFLGADGIYLTNGSNPVKVTENIDGLFTGSLPSWTPYSRLLNPPTNYSPKFAWTDNKLYAAVGNASSGGTNTTTVVTYDVAQKACGYYTLGYGVEALVAFPWADQTYPLPVGVCDQAATTRTPFAFYPSTRTDGASTFIPVDFQLNWFQAQVGKSDGVVDSDNASIARLDVWGRGHMQVGTATDYAVTPSSWSNLPLAAVPAGDVWDNSSFWGSGSDPTDVWGGSITSASDIMRLTAPDHQYVSNLVGRGRYLTLRFTKMADADYVYLERPRVTLFGR